MKSIQRCKEVLMSAAATEPDINSRFIPVEYSIARMSLGEKPDEEGLYRELDTLYRKIDCSDFSICMILRMMNLFSGSSLMSDKLKDDIKKELLRYDYWYDVENVRFPGSTIMWTENHAFFFRSDQFLAGKLYKDDVFKTGKTGSEMAAEVRDEVLDWIDIKLKTGFCEWDSTPYIPGNVQSLLNLYDFADDEEVSSKAKQLLDVMMFSVALHSFDGYPCSSEGRTYAKNLLKIEKNEMDSVKYILWNREGYHPSNAGVFLATSKYEGFEKADEAYCCTDTLESYEQQGFCVEDGPLFGRGYTTDHDLELYWQTMGYTHKLTLENNIKMGEKYNIQINHQLNSKYKYSLEHPEDDISIRGACYLGRANTVLYKTKDFALSSVQDYRKGEEGFSQHVWQATLPGGTYVFTNNPGTLGFGDSRPDFWSGNSEHPKALQYKDVLICIHKVSEKMKYRFSHAYFPTEEMDSVVCIGSYAFGRKGDSFISLYSSGGMKWGEGENAKNELVCDSPFNIWVCRPGSQSEYGSFENFVAEMLRSGVACEKDGITLQTEYGQLSAGWDSDFCLDGKVIPTRDFMRFENPFCRSEYMTGVYEYL